MMTEAKTERFDRKGITKKYLGKFEDFKDTSGREFFKMIYRDEDGVIVHIVPLLTLYPLPKVVKEEK